MSRKVTTDDTSRMDTMLNTTQNLVQLLTDTTQRAGMYRGGVQQPRESNAVQIGLGPGEEIEILSVVKHELGKKGELLFLVVSTAARTYYLTYIVAVQIDEAKLKKYCKDNKLGVEKMRKEGRRRQTKEALRRGKEKEKREKSSRRVARSGIKKVRASGKQAPKKKRKRTVKSKAKIPAKKRKTLQTMPARAAQPLPTAKALLKTTTSTKSPKSPDCSTPLRRSPSRESSRKSPGPSTPLRRSPSHAASRKSPCSSTPQRSPSRATAQGSPSRQSTKRSILGKEKAGEVRKREGEVVKVVSYHRHHGKADTVLVMVSENGGEPTKQEWTKQEMMMSAREMFYQYYHKNVKAADRPTKTSTNVVKSCPVTHHSVPDLVEETDMRYWGESKSRKELLFGTKCFVCHGKFVLEVTEKMRMSRAKVILLGKKNHPYVCQYFQRCNCKVCACNGCYKTAVLGGGDTVGTRKMRSRTA